MTIIQEVLIRESRPPPPPNHHKKDLNWDKLLENIDHLQGIPVLVTDEGEPESFQEVQSHKNKDCWIKTMQEEMNSLWKNDTYELTELPNGRKSLKNKWAFKLKKKKKMTRSY